MNTQWYAREGKPFGDIKISPVPKEAISDCGRANFDRNKETCDQLELERHIGVDQQESRSKFFNRVYLNNSDSTVFTFPVLTHPIYVGNSSIPGKFDLVLFTGQSWVMTDVMEFNITSEQSRLSMQEYLDSDPSFPEFLFSLIFFGEYVDVVTNFVNGEDNEYTPLGMRWFRPQEQDPLLPGNYPTADQSRPVEMSLSCATCNNSTNPCLFGGICLEDGTCDCINGGNGALCGEIPAGDSVCHPYFNTEMYDWDGGDCCGKIDHVPAFGFHSSRILNCTFFCFSSSRRYMYRTPMWNWRSHPSLWYWSDGCIWWLAV